MIIVCPLNKVQQLVDEHGVRHVVSLLAPDTPHETPRGISPDRHLRLYFHDIAHELEGYRPPRAEDAVKLIQYLRDWNAQGPILIHCWAGISRSTAAAFVTLCMFRRQAEENALAQELRSASPSATPNRLVVSLADDALGREGRMVSAIDGIGRGADAFEGRPFTLKI